MQSAVHEQEIVPAVGEYKMITADYELEHAQHPVQAATGDYGACLIGINNPCASETSRHSDVILSQLGINNMPHSCFILPIL